MNEAGRRLAAADAAQDIWLDHRRWCGYCHIDSRNLCPLGKHLLNDYYQAQRRMRALMEAESMALMRMAPYG